MNREIFVKNIGMLGLITCLSACGNGHERPHQQGGTMQVEGYRIEPQTLPNDISTTGSVLANEEVQLKSEVSGRIERINFKEGEAVRKGQLLVQIDNEQNVARLKRVKVQLKQAQKNLDRQEELLDVEGISEEVYEEAQLKVADLESQKAELQAQLDDTEIRAPFEGTIGLRQVSPGSFVNAGDNIAYLVQDNPIKLEFSVPEGYAGQVRENNFVNFTVGGINDTQRARVYAVEPRVNPESRSIAIRARADNQDHKLVPGAFAEVQVSLDTLTNAILIPSNAIITENQGKSVFIIKNGKSAKKRITTGVRTESKIHVLKGLNPNDTVVVTGLLGLKPGVAIGISNLVNETAKTAQQ